jgi:hypothetical protein
LPEKPDCDWIRTKSDYPQAGGQFMQAPFESGYLRRTAVFLIIISVAIITNASLLRPNSQRAIRASQPESFTVEQIKGYPFPNELTASATGSRIAWAFNERGARNVWVAEGPDFKARRLTNYNTDDGQELTSLSISADGNYVVYVRGGDHGSNFDSSVGVNPAMSATQMRVQVWSVPFAGGEAKFSDTRWFDTSETLLLRTRRLWCS